MRRTALVLATVLFAVLFIGTASAHAATPVGKWTTYDDDTGKPKGIVEIWEKDGKLRGKIIKLLNLKPGDDPNPGCDKCEGHRKGKPVVGMTILWNMVQDDDEWEDGKILDPENGETYRCKMWLEGHDKLKVRGYVGPFYRTQTWKRRP